MVNAITNEKAPLEDLMAAMDVVDTLRHDQGIAERELDGEGRRERLLERLREMYAAQGIEVPDHVLAEGIDALEHERFQYKAVESSCQTRVARLWVSRTKWGKPLGFLAVLASVFYGYYFVAEVMPERTLRVNLPTDIARHLEQITAGAKNPEIVIQAQQYAANAERAIANNDFTEAQGIVENMALVQSQLNQEYDIRVISRSDENSGVFRNPPGNAARNYYLIVEAIDDRNRSLELTIVNQENNKATQKKTWGLRVNEETFYKIASDKRDDGIIQNNKVGRKRAGYLKPEFSIPTTGATITEW